MCSHIGTLERHTSYILMYTVQEKSKVRKKWGSAIIALTEGVTNALRQRRSEKRKKKKRRWKRGRRRPEWQGPVPAEQAGIIRAGK